MRVLVCGGRDYDDADALYAKLDELHKVTPFSAVIHGRARGADLLAHSWAATRRVGIQGFAANWAMYGKAAGPMRNQKMISEGCPDLVVAFKGGSGTADMVRRAKAAGIKVIEVA